MTEGLIKILFNNTQVQIIAVETVGGRLTDSPTWCDLATWWMQHPTSPGYEALTLYMADGSILLLKRAEITSIGMTPKQTLNIGPKLP